MTTSRKETNNTTRRLEGFTIVELLIVIVVIGILAAISIVSYTGIQNRAHATAVNSDLNNNAKKLEEYKILNSLYPQNINEFRAANLSFTQNSVETAIYCMVENSTTSDWVIIIKPVGGQAVYKRSQGGISMFSGAISGTTACNSVGLTTITSARWLKLGEVWTDWVVY